MFSCIMLLQPFISTCFSDNNSFQVQLSSENVFQGKVALIRVFPAHNIKSVKYFLDKKAVNFYLEKKKDTFSAFLAIDLEEPPGTKTLTIKIMNTNGLEIIQKKTFNVVKFSFPTQRLTLPESKVTLSKKNLGRYNREKAQTKSIFENSATDKLWNSSFIKPYEGKLSTRFGVRRILNNKPKSPHSGVDLKAPEGAPVVSSGDGIVSFTGDHFFTGNSVYIDHGTEIISMYFHLSSISVKMGDKVSRGQVIGHVGSTGRSTGPHLHWGVRINGNRVDPFSLLELFNK